MIDYEKLKMAHELLQKVRVKECSIALHVGHYNNIVLTYIDENELRHEYEFSNLDDLTTKLYGFFPKRPKYDLGQLVYYVQGTLIVHANIIQLPKSECDVYIINSYLCEDLPIKEKMIFPSKRLLIQDQITYWKTLANEVGNL